jgi:hypothetical protein
MTAFAVHVTVLEFLGRGFAHFDEFDREMQILAGHRMVEVHVDHAHADLLDRHRARAEVRVEDDLHARLQRLAFEVLLRDALRQALALLALGLGGRHVDLDLLAGLEIGSAHD